MYLAKYFKVKRSELVYNPKKIYEQVVKGILDDLAISFDAIHEGQILLDKELPEDKRKILERALLLYSIKIAKRDSESVVDQIKNCVRMVVANHTLPKKKLSTVLSDKLGYSYSHLSAVVSKETYTSIENIHIFIRIEKTKEMLINGNRTLADVAHNLGYSSVAHLSRQFKNVTGLTVSQYLKLVATRKGG